METSSPSPGFAEPRLAMLKIPDLHAVLQREVAAARETIALSEVRLLPPVGPANRIFCVGLNYQEHVAETRNETQAEALKRPSAPTIFLRLLSSFVGSGEPLQLPAVSDKFDWEGELVAIIGKPAYRITAEDARNHIAGYSIANEGSIRDWQLASPQWTMGKNFDKSGSIGPEFVTADELPPGARGLRIRTRLNGKVMQDDITDSMIFDIPTVIAYLSQAMKLETGDVILTGTPSGIGIARKPPILMADGDVCEVEVEGIGILSNQVRPFKIRRLGHFGFNLPSLDAGLDFYGRKLGFLVTDEVKLREMDPELFANVEDDRIIFFTCNTDHHSFLITHPSLEVLFGEATKAEKALSHMSWQVGSLEEVVQSLDYFRARGTEIRRCGRDMPGSNWHAYMRDPDGQTVEIYYGMEQVGLLGSSKPREMYDRRFESVPSLPQISDLQEIANARGRGVDVQGGYRIRDLATDATFNVGGVLLPRPFKISKAGPVGLFVDDVASTELFYTETMGFTTTERVQWEGHACAYMRHGTDHHSLKLYPKALRKKLGLSEHTDCASIGLQVGSYRQLKDAVAWLRRQGCEFVTLPDALSPGIDYAAHVLDPAGHCLQLYYYMEQVGWDGRPRTASERRVAVNPWPEMLDPLSDTYAGQSLLGPLG